MSRTAKGTLSTQGLADPAAIQPADPATTAEGHVCSPDGDGGDGELSHGLDRMSLAAFLKVASEAPRQDELYGQLRERFSAEHRERLDAAKNALWVSSDADPEKEDFSWLRWLHCQHRSTPQIQISHLSKWLARGTWWVVRRLSQSARSPGQEGVSVAFVLPPPNDARWGPWPACVRQTTAKGCACFHRATDAA